VQREKQRHRQAAIRDVVRGGEALLEVGDRLSRNGDDPLP